MKCKAAWALLVLGIGITAYANEPLPNNVPTPEKAPLMVRALSGENITLFRDNCINQEDTRTLMRNVALGAAVAGAGYMYYKWINGPDMGQAATRKDLDELAMGVAKLRKENNDLRDRVNDNEAGREQTPGWATWFKKKADWVGNTVYAVTPSLIWSFGRSYLFGEISRFLWPVLPTVGSYLSDKASINWCMVKKTHFYHALVMLINWTSNVMTDPESSSHNKELAISSNQMVSEMEKVIGYMGFVVQHLSEKKTQYKERGNATIETIQKEVQGLVSFINGYLTLPDQSPDDMVGMIMFLRKSLFSIICQIENFEVVTIEAGLSDTDEQDLLTGLKEYVMPEWKNIRPEIPGKDQESEFVRKVLLQIAENSL